jgi:hypothetical protein
MNREQHTQRIYGIINNGGFNLNSPGNQGRYTRSHHFQTLDEWDTIFENLTGCPNGVYDTADFLQNMMFMQLTRNNGNFEYESFPEIIWIPLPCSVPNFHRCILHVETVIRETGQLTGNFIPIEITYHDNHPITQAFTRMFEVSAHDPPTFRTNEDLILMTTTTIDNVSLERICKCLTRGGDDFERFNNWIDANRIENANLTTASRHILYDPEMLTRANNRQNELTLAHRQANGEREMSIRESEQVYCAWRDIVFPESTAQEERYAYSTYAADQIMMHRYCRLYWAREYYDHPNPIVLPFAHQYQRENNPVDHNRALQRIHNQYIQSLYDGQNNDERARIEAIHVELRQNEIPI